MLYSKLILLIFFCLINVFDFQPVSFKMRNTKLQDENSNEDETSKKKLIPPVYNRKYFQDIFVDHSEPLKITFGHISENPDIWEQKFEQRDIRNKNYRGKVRWGNKDGEYGEFYWDLNNK